MISKEISRIPISVIVMTKDEERNIEKCLRSVANFEEVFVVDSGSEDRTCQIAEEMGVEVFQFHWDGKYPKKKQWCLENLPFMFDWVLYVDADEEVYPSLSEEMRELMIAGPKYDGYFVGYDYVFQSSVLKHGHRVYKLVLFNRHRGYFPIQNDLEVTRMWEVEGHYQPIIEGSVGMLKNRMLHCDHDSLFSFFKRLNLYSDWEAYMRLKGRLREGGGEILEARRLLQRLGDRVPFPGIMIFFYSYFIKLGLLDGRAGFDYAMALAIYYSMISLKINELIIVNLHHDGL
jgi:glycosyltransferase involved in cell wall biosynthesis